MKIIIRSRTLKRGAKSYYLDINHKGVRIRDNLGIIIELNDPQKSNKLRLIEAIRIKRENDYISNNFGVSLQNANINFIAYFFDYMNSYLNRDKRKVASTYNHLVECFGKYLPISSLNYKMCEQFERHLRLLAPETERSYFGVFRRVIKQAIIDGHLRVDPSIGVKLRKVDKKSINKNVLSIDEIKLLSVTRCGNNNVKRAFLFSCFTGLGLAEIINLKWSNIVDRNLVTKRAKTNMKVDVFLSDSTFDLLGSRSNGKIFNLPSHSAVGKSLKVWTKLAGIEKHITYYCARHSFACNLLIHGADLKTVSNLMAHSSVEQTGQYLKHIDQLKRDAIENLPSL